MDATGKQLKCVIVTPERIVLDTDASFVAVPLFDGELGVLPGRSPLIGKLEPGELRTVSGTTTRRFYIEGGIAQVKENVVTVLTSVATPAENLDVEAAKTILEEAPTVTAFTPEVIESQRRARVKLRIAHAATSAGSGTSAH